MRAGWGRSGERDPGALPRLVGRCATPIAILISMTLGSRPAHAAEDLTDQNWPQWRGPLASGAAPKSNPPVQWGDGKNIRWKAPIPGSGTATPIVWGDRIFIQTAIDTGKKGE